MEKGNIKIVEIADFKNSEHVLDYVDNDFVIINSLEGSPYNEDTIRLGCFLIAICLEGCIQLDVNYKTYQLEAGDLLLGLPNTIISHAMVSPKHKIRLAAFSTQFLQRVVKMEKDTWNTVMHIHNNPIKSVGEIYGSYFPIDAERIILYFPYQREIRIIHNPHFASVY